MEDHHSISKEIICINIGQAGVQLSNAAWELFCIEHGIQANGRLLESIESKSGCGFSTFFEEVRGNQYVPRCVSVDLEPTVLDEVRMGPYRSLFHPDQLISGFEDAANNYGRGFNTCGKVVIDRVLDRIRKLSYNCENLQGFIIMNSVGGGSGSGFTSLLLSKMEVEYAKRDKFQLAIYPGTQLATAVVEPYNTVMSLRSTKEQTDITVMMDNESIYDICGISLDISKPTFNNLNRLIAQVFSSETASLRFQNSLNNDLTQLVTNLVPFPIMHFPLANYAPILTQSRAQHQDLCTTEITRAIFEPFCQMVRCNVSLGRYMSCCLQYRGDIHPRDVNEAIFEIKRRPDIQFVDWCPTGFKVSICCQPPVAVTGSQMAQTIRSVTMLANTSAIGQVFNAIIGKFDLLYAKRAFVHWYVAEGLEEGEFTEVRNEVRVLEKDYLDICGSLEDEIVDTSKSRSESKKHVSVRDKENVTISDKNVTISDKNISVSDKNISVSDKNKTISDKNISVSDKNKTISDKNIVIEEANNITGEVDDIQPDENQVDGMITDDEEEEGDDYDENSEDSMDFEQMF